VGSKNRDTRPFCAAIGIQQAGVRIRFNWVRVGGGGAAIGEAATGAEVGQEHPLVVVEHLGRLGHEMDAAEDDRPGIHLGGRPGQLEAVARDVGEILDLPLLVIMGEDRGIFALFEGEDFVVNVGQIRSFPCFFRGERRTHYFSRSKTVHSLMVGTVSQLGQLQDNP
jgi:hypothetical protein